MALQSQRGVEVAAVVEEAPVSLLKKQFCLGLWGHLQGPSWGRGCDIQDLAGRREGLDSNTSAPGLFPSLPSASPTLPLPGPHTMGTAAWVT